MANGLLRHDDPRLGLAVEPLAPADPAVTLIISVLENLLRYRQFGALAAPAAGFSRNMLVIKSNNQLVPIFHPVLAEAKDPALVPDERHVLTADLIRATCRANAVTITGTGTDAAPINVNVAGPVAHEVQQALELLAGQPPLRWLSAYQRAVVEHAPSPVRLNAALAGVLRDITAQTAADGCSFDWPVLTIAPGVMIDLRDPGRPCDPTLQDILALSQMVQDPRAVLMSGDALISLLPALATGSTGAQLQFRNPSPAAQRFLDRTGDPRISAAPAGADTIATLALVDARDHTPDARQLAQALALPDGIAIIMRPAPDDALAQDLKTAFVEVHKATSPAATFYIASRLELNLTKTLTGFLRNGVDLSRWRDRLTRLDKDGQERPVWF